MPIDPAAVREGIARAAAALGKRRLALAYSGGRDSTVLLDIVAQDAPLPLRALYVEHGLQGPQPRWRDSLAANCAHRDVALVVLDAAVEVGDGASVEAAARDARYDQLARALGSDELLLVAQHQDDQAESLMLQLLRGAGPAGLAAMPVQAPLGTSTLLRPLLTVSGDDIARYARDAGLTWFDDPTNAEERFDRNFLRRRVMPVLAERWPGVATTLARSARWQSEADRLATTLAAADARRLAPRPDRVNVGRLAVLDADRQRNLLRFLCRSVGLGTPDARRLEALRQLAMGAAPRGEVRWPGAEARRYRETLHLTPPLPGPPPDDWEGQPDAAGRVVLPAAYGILSFAHRATDLPALHCRFRRGGERIRAGQDRPSTPFAAWCQREGVAPWLRTRLPLTFAGDTLVAVGTRPVGPDYSGLAPLWQGAPRGLET